MEDIERFRALKKKAEQYFAGLRDLPETGGKFWQPYFRKTLDTYTELWRMQQKKRSTLENAGEESLTRWEIGEIASRIAQLYYHYYLRTSRSDALKTAFDFYSCVRSRKYFVFENFEPVEYHFKKKLRYYARFIAVCLLQQNHTLTEEIFEDLVNLVQDFREQQPSHLSLEWLSVIQEVNQFLRVEKSVLIAGATANYRLSDSLNHMSKAFQQFRPLRLSEAVLMGNRHNQIKFSEITLDMYRFMQSLEHDLSEGASIPDYAANPHKSILYRPTFDEFMFVLSTANSEMLVSSAILLYLSADPTPNGIQLNASRFPASPEPLWSTAINDETETRDDTDSDGNTEFRDTNCLQLADIAPFSRKPMFIVVESSSSITFEPTPRSFKQPLVCLMSPKKQSLGWEAIEENEQSGSLFTYFLTAPVVAFAHVFQVENITLSQMSQSSNRMNEAFSELESMLLESSEIHSSIKIFLSNCFTNNYLMRFIFCRAVVSLIEDSDSKEDFMPRSSPHIPDAFINSEPILNLISYLKETLAVDVTTQQV
eukprot:gb/GECH01014922.1/.p1 GENE.gb/GECH01014922.1/~~gb/GECH01014922.1/.p1  ORF type:complete len:539 (+),score=69.80 gb/GECH01014922.1/:1-1617(+)